MLTDLHNSNESVHTYSSELLLPYTRSVHSIHFPLDTYLCEHTSFFFFFYAIVVGPSCNNNNNNNQKEDEHSGVLVSGG